MRPALQPESIEKLRKRYHVAVATLLDEESISLGVLSPPSQRREHLFDFDVGLRLCIRKQKTDRGVGRVVSCAFTSTSEVADDIVAEGRAHGLAAAVHRFSRLVDTYYHKIADDAPEMELLGVTSDYTLYVVYWE